MSVLPEGYPLQERNDETFSRFFQLLPASSSFLWILTASSGLFWFLPASLPTFPPSLSLSKDEEGREEENQSWRKEEILIFHGKCVVNENVRVDRATENDKCCQLRNFFSVIERIICEAIEIEKFGVFFMLYWKMSCVFRDFPILNRNIDGKEMVEEEGGRRNIAETKVR